MLTLFNLIKPLPLNFKLYKPSNETDKYFNYKEYVNMDSVCSNLLKGENSVLLDYLTIYSNNHYKFRDILYYNLQNVIVKNISLNARLDGAFNMYYNESSLLRYVNRDTIYHEILHMASTYYDRHNNILFTGFNYCDLTKKISVGEGLTEGYVQLLTDRDTNNGNMLYERDLTDDETKVIFPVIYCYSNALASQLEVIIGKEKLEQLFFNGDFNGLMDELLKYSDKKNILRFLKNCDIASIHNYRFIKCFDNKVLEAQDFLFDICSNYMPDKYTEIAENEIVKSKLGNYNGIFPIKIFKELSEKKIKRLKK